MTYSTSKIKIAIGRSQLLISIFLAIVLATPAAVMANAAEMTGREVMDEVRDRHDADHELEHQRMTLIDANGNESERRVRRYSRLQEDENYRYLVVFDEPASVRGTALLTWQHSNADDEQWTRLPAMGRELRRVSSGGRSNYFMGTDFTYEDLVSEDMDNFQYQRLDDESDENGNALFVLRVTPVDDSVNTGYESREIRIDQDNFTVVQVDYYEERTGEHLKRMTIEEQHKVEGRDEMWRPDVTLMENFREDHQTRVESLERSLDPEDVPNRTFEKRFVTSGRYMR
ncbi:outer membrane lipoprotein-sorting protein [Vreelandella massiliensis]|uniref:outer membrane lipoprotein-sorting protein n=1 Tax=Vreelandella massiliensis TaxID=1816686 RepID=UPI0009FAE908|nr:outer membrane lipoprotein-sorting protein [Halomonas massiliensis]